MYKRQHYSIEGEIRFALLEVLTVLVEDSTCLQMSCICNMQHGCRGAVSRTKDVYQNCTKDLRFGGTLKTIIQNYTTNVYPDIYIICVRSK